MSRVVIIVAVAVVACVTSRRTEAQSYPQIRSGMTFAAGLGAGSGDVTCDGCEFDIKTGPTGFIRVGGALNSNLILAGQLNAWQRSKDGEKRTFGFVLATAQWYPYTPAGWYIEGGLGVGRVRIEEDLTGELRSRSLSFMIGTGYDFRVASGFSLTPFLNLVSATGDEAKLNGTSISERVGGNLVQFGLALTWH